MGSSAIARAGFFSICLLSFHKDPPRPRMQPGRSCISCNIVSVFHSGVKRAADYLVKMHKNTQTRNMPRPVHKINSLFTFPLWSERRFSAKIRIILEKQKAKE